MNDDTDMLRANHRMTYQPKVPNKNHVQTPECNIDIRGHLLHQDCTVMRIGEPLLAI